MAPVKISASKEDFLRAINLDPSKEADKKAFDGFWTEVVSYWQQRIDHTDPREMLKSEYHRHCHQKPYKWAYFDAAYIDRATDEIWCNASWQARPYFDLGSCPRNKNWVIKWLLWHVCRYRDWRNRKNKPSPVEIKLETQLLEEERNERPSKAFWDTVMSDTSDA